MLPKNLNLALRVVFPLSLFLSAMLLFGIQPMVAKTLLPVYGGTPAVWTVCMLFFQVIVLLAYGYIWLLNRNMSMPTIAKLHSILLGLSCITLPLVLHPINKQGLPEWEILSNLLTALGFPLFLIASSAPLIQLAYSRTQAKDASDPYFLYIASNVGSLLALLAYPWLIERFIGLQYQWYAWNAGYCLYILLLLYLLLAGPYLNSQQEKASYSWPWKAMGYWVFLSFIPCSLMLSLTLYITTDIAATPLFWVIPLALYLLTFILAFTNKTQGLKHFVMRNALLILVFTSLSFIVQAVAWQVILLHVSGFFILALLCHSTLFHHRPSTEYLTLFYFCLAMGGVLAGIFNGLIAPHVFNAVFEYPLSLLLAALVIPTSSGKKTYFLPVLILALLLIGYYFPVLNFKGFTSLALAGILALALIATSRLSKGSLFLSLGVLFLFIFLPSLQKFSPIVQQRSFYAVNKVIDYQGVHAFLSQSTVHGLQQMDDKSDIPNGYTSYYAATKPVVAFLQQELPRLSVTIMGLGAGTMLCQFRKADQVKVIEIDKQVIDIANNPSLFTYLRDCPPAVDIMNQDGRLATATLANNSQDLLVLDAFNSDAIPIHLMTQEAFNLYKNKITPGGALLVNISNRHLRLLPLINALAQNLDLIALQLAYQGDTAKGEMNAHWALLTSNQALAFHLLESQGWSLLDQAGYFLWTDNYSNLLPLLRM